VNKKTLTATESPATWGAYPAERLTELLSSFSSLRTSNRILIEQIRGSISELLELRSRLREKQADLAGTDAKMSQRVLKERFRLTRRELEVAQLLAKGRSNQAIARELKISAHTARHHTQRILSKLEVHSRGEAGAKIRGG
jgi:DNA-binding NarL/FixJ family response regulator